MMLNKRKKEENKRHSYFLFSILVLIISFVGLEILIRVSIFTDYLPIKPLRNPWLYASWYDDDDFWKLYYKFKGEFKPPPSVAIHPLLGWSQEPIDTDNPLGLRKENLEFFSSSKKQILFYGDSFVDGVVSSQDYQIPRYIAKRLNDAVVIDLGCGGYGLDQMYLLFKLTHEKSHNPLVIFGILVEDDLDRSILSVRTGQKPYFIVQNEKLVLQGVPMDSIPAHYFATNPPKIKSYLFRMVFRATTKGITLLGQSLNIGKSKWFINRKMNDKILINTKIIEGIDTLCKTQGYSLLFVLFHGQYELASGGCWQTEFLKSLFHGMNIRYIDTADFLRSYNRQYSIPFSDFYVNEGFGEGHHNNLGNRIISEGLIEYLSRESDYD
ncbi:MAG: SGNH/GDSL hydrolase family protein [Candidatus Omnitrophota bacterium]|jgi:hypothetical protein